jgi:hypothetical protein
MPDFRLAGFTDTCHGHADPAGSMRDSLCYRQLMNRGAKNFEAPIEWSVMGQKVRAKRIGDRFKPIAPSSRHAWHFIRSNKIEHKLPAFLVGGLWLARLNKFEDRWEGKLPERNLGLLNKLMRPNDVEAVIAGYKKAAATGYASCWHLNDGHPDPAMWAKSNFGDNHDGIALRSSYDLLRTELASLIAKSGDGPLHISEVRYIDHTQELLPEGQTLEVAFSVRDDYSFQKELRVFLTTTWRSAAEALLPKTNPWGGPLVPPELIRGKLPTAPTKLNGSIPEPVQRGEAVVPIINPKVLIDRVLVGYRMNPNKRDKLMAMLQTAGLEDRVEFEPKP